MSSELFQYVVCGACGVVFGVAIEKGRVHEPQFIRAQMDMSYYVMMKMFLGATAAGMATMSLLSMFSDSGNRKLQQARATYMTCLRGKGYLSAMVGGGLLGAGMTLSGACPGMVLVQVGSQVHNSLYTFAGGLLGAFLYGLLEPTVSELTRSYSSRSHQTLDERHSYASAALPLAAVIGCCVAGLEFYRPWRSEVSGGWTCGSVLVAKAWPPYIAGALIGALQPVVVETIGDTLGTSSSYCTLVSQVLITDRLRRAFSYLSRFRTGLGNWWQIAFICGAMAGGYLSANWSGNLGLSSPVTMYQAIAGGAAMVFGSRIAGGCTSGHGLSGMSFLILNSFAAVVCMFAGGMATQAAMQKGYLNF